VAKGVTLVAVRVLDCNGSGSESGVISGIDWVTGNHPDGVPAVANMSLGGGAFPSLDDAVTTSIADGVVYAVAAGNSSTDACTTSPARTPNALTVAATSASDARASFSNLGSCVDLFAPGVGITSDWNTSDGATNTISGTSMATPHVAGVAALTFAGLGAGATAGQVSDAVLANTTPGIVTDAGSGTPNRLLYVGSEPAPPPPPPPPPPVNDAFVKAITLSGASGAANGSSVHATKEAGEPNHAGNAGGASIWYAVTPTASGTATFDTLGSTFDTLLGVYTGGSVNAPLTTIASNDDIAYPLILESSVSVSVTAGVTYHIAVDGWNAANGSVTLNWNVPVSSAPPPPAPTLSVADASVVEGRAGKRTMQFTVALSAPATTTVSVSFATGGGTATAGSDYVAKTGTVSISAGATTATISITVKGDRTVEPNEAFSVILSNPSGGATIADGQGIGTIVNDD
jgi:subtilisin family serine protease